MSVPTVAPTAQELADARYTGAQAVRDVVVAGVLAQWATVDVGNIAGSFGAGAWASITALIRAGQRKVVEGADEYVGASLRSQNLEVSFVGELVPERFEGASDGRKLERLVAQGVIDSKIRIAQGVEPRQALRDTGNDFFRRMVSNQVMDAARVADQTAIVLAEPAEGAEFPEAPEKPPASYTSSPNPLPPLDFQKREREETPTEPAYTKKAAKLDKFGNPMGGRFGFIRMLALPSCSRCALLAGRWYGWNAGFARHDLCDCRHIPCLLANPDVPNMLVDPRAYFDSLTPAEQNKYFGVNAAKALREEGSDIYQVVNATTRKGSVYVAGGRKYTRDGTTRRGIYYQEAKVRGKKLPPRLTPEQIFKDAGNDRGEAVRLLRQYGYIVT